MVDRRADLRARRDASSDEFADGTRDERDGHTGGERSVIGPRLDYLDAPGRQTIGMTMRAIPSFVGYRLLRGGISRSRSRHGL